MIVNEEGKFNKDVLAMGNNSIIKYEQLLEAYNGGQYTMVLIKNLATILKRFFCKHNITKFSTRSWVKTFKAIFFNCSTSF
jgi:hypothetical protein